MVKSLGRLWLRRYVEVSLGKILILTIYSCYCNTNNDETNNSSGQEEILKAEIYFCAQVQDCCHGDEALTQRKCP